MTIWSHVARSRLSGLLALAAVVMAPLPVTAAGASNEYAEIDTREAVDLVKTLAATQGHENDALVATIQRQPQKYPPVVFFPLAQLLYRQGDLDGAIFWLNAGRLRATFDARLCTDRSAGAGVGALMATMPPELRRAQFDDTGKLRAIMERVITWDETTPYDYDHRWIALHGLGAMRHGLEAGDNGPAQPLTIPKDQWDAVARKSRAELREGFALAIDSVEKNRPPQQAGAPQPGKPNP
ncbi:hypothetical protein [Nitrospirillum iridis]|uniref:Tetratricopeptide repeat protein n=1 Tax=Nitrospirillum iridis TaxID=765888 RepID=A0A7X0EE86_9PROT|nr:hypothetical protein [Nitrospirillum iridis]MBB6252780.1 hypothetical protein [Nitrospirillum iridis]